MPNLDLIIPTNYKSFQELIYYKKKSGGGGLNLACSPRDPSFSPACGKLE